LIIANKRSTNRSKKTKFEFGAVCGHILNTLPYSSRFFNKKSVHLNQRMDIS